MKNCSKSIKIKLVALTLLLLVACKSSSTHSIQDFYSQEVKDELLSFTNKYSQKDSYLTHEVYTEQKIRIISLSSCGGCYLQELIDKSTQSITLENGLEIKILNRSDIENFEVTPNKVYMYITGGGYSIETDFKGKILRKVVHD